MTTYFFVSATTTLGRGASSPPCATIDDALRGANFMLGNGAAAVWIVDAKGDLILPADQVKIRLSKVDFRLRGAAA
jgi:hypothetical protein